ncbi:MAG: glycosyltransferase family 39 protein [Chloroflexota bacterium]
MTPNSADYSNPLGESAASGAGQGWLFWLVWAALVAALFYRLGGAALFEPDEGRNSEKAREILVLNDWITPHENFHAVLDKPIFYYWLVAASFNFFGLSEWAARLPSALAAFGCLVLIYRFALVRWGRWVAFWSILILLASTEFFILARVVIFDMSLTFFLTLALWAFYEAAHSEDTRRRRVWCLVLYSALAIATLIKGLIGIMIPGMVIFFYLLLSHRWAVLQRIYLISGILLFLAIVLPWYLAANAHNDGYLRYYLWDEHFGRFTTSQFDRSEPWFYFVLVLLVGFFPWTLLLPVVVKDAWKARRDDKTLYLILWVALPLLFFSASKSKLPHYILPIFPALAVLTAASLVRAHRHSGAQLRFNLSLTWWIQAATALYMALGTFFPMILVRQIRDTVDSMASLVWVYAAVSVAVLVYLITAKHTGEADRQRSLYWVQSLGLCCLLVFVVEMEIAVAPDRSAKAIASAARRYVAPATQVVFYDTYLAGTAFYLRTEQPIWLITNGKKKRTFLGNYYALGKRADPVTRWGQAMLDFNEFRNRWKSAKQPLLIIVKEKNLSRLEENVGESLRRLAAADEYLVVAKP